MSSWSSSLGEMAAELKGLYDGRSQSEISDSVCFVLWISYALGLAALTS